jgi:hypothetical protein
MAIGLFAGMTDYSHQSISDIIEDLDFQYRNISAYIEMIEKNKAILESNKYWQENVPFSFKGIAEYALKHYKTTQEELGEVKIEIGELVEEHHVKRIGNIAKVAHEINIDIGQIWHRDYPNKNHGSKNFRIVERIYADTRDMAVNMLDCSNIAERLKDFIGRKKSVKKTIPQDEIELLNILFISSSPNGEDRIRVDKELRKIEEHMESSKLRDKVVLNKKVAVKPETISKAMLDFNPNIVHFSGHGDIDGIVIENDEGDSVFFSVKGLDRLFSLFNETTKCVILNACYSKEQAETISKHGIYVIGMNDSIGDEAAINFTVGFYQAIGAGKKIDFAFDMGMVLISQNIDDANIPTLWKDGAKIK